ncbi:MAG: site-specific DNA-methyltransferase [Clostridia bacterium]|nr:site-specific DNA-methyltransferase [bacterium]MBQ8426094.1 site-specific DNA-methyltransferase [Clostridia bacterium]MBQ8522107.1 site-specific DNA-methyltransferase [Clostridia bacterium]
MEKLDGMTKDLVKENIEKLKELFPTIVKEDKIDFEELQLILGEDINNNKEQYSFVWNGKTEATKLAQKRSTGTLRPCIEESKNWDTTKNIYIEGDNLEVLKLLQSSYNGRIKMIYIDPPYNTGHDFVYKDNFEDNIANYKEVTGQAQKSNADTDGRYHTNWLNMMYPRLKLARNLLTENGVIFISIDDHEVYNLKKICDEIFGENNFITKFVWEKGKEGGNDSSILRSHYDNILCYCKNFSASNIINLDEKDTSRHIKELPEENLVSGIIEEINKGELFQLVNLSKQKDYTVNIPLKDGSVIEWPSYAPQKSIDEWIKIGKVFVGKRKVPYIKSFLKDELQGQKPSNIIGQEHGTTKAGSIEMREFFGSRDVFSYPKPSALIGRLAEIGSQDDSIILDFFSGSATTAHSVIDLNAKKGTHRKFICVQLPEMTEETSEARKLGFTTLCEIGKERIRRAGEQIKNNRNIKINIDKNKLMQRKVLDNGDFDDKFAIKVEAPNEQYLDNLDIGFKVFKLDSSNLKKWNNTPTKDADEVAKRIQISLDYLENDRTELDLVYEIMLKYGIDLTLPITKTANEKAYIVNGEEYKLLICSQMNLKLEDIEEFANESVGTYLFADRCFSDDNLLINAQEILKAKNKEMRLF